MADERHCSECGGKLPSDAPQGLCPQCLMKAGLPTGADSDEADSSEAPSGVPTSVTPPSGFVPPQPAELAQQFPHLEIIELLGQGGMGAVYKARQKQLDRPVALKILPPQVGQDPAFAERFTREARSLARLNHPHIVTVHDFGKTEAGLYYFLMEFVDGTDLRRVIQAGELSPAEALAVVPQICEALQYAHDEGIVHRDIKPENVLLDKKGRVRIADFGLAKLLDRPATVYTLTRAGQRMGTPHYMAPEQIEHPDQVDHRADIYSLGVVFYEMLTGELPIGRFAPPSRKVQVDVRLDDVVLRTLEKEPERRYQHASEVKTDVESIKADSGPAEPTIGLVGKTDAPVPVKNRMEKHVTLVAVINLVFGAMGVLAAAIVFTAIVGGGRISQDPTAMRITSLVGSAIAIFLVVTSVPEIIGGIGLLKRRPWARILVIIIAVVDLIQIPIGTAIGIYELWVLLSNETAELFAHAFAGRKNGLGVQTKQGGGKLLWRIVLATVIFLLLALFLLTFVVFGLGYFTPGTTQRSLEPYGQAEPAPRQTGQPDLPRGTPNYLTFGPEGPTLSDECVQTMELTPSEAMEVNGILRTAYQQYLELEGQHTKQSRTANSLAVIISPFGEQAKRFLEQVWLDLDTVLDDPKRSLARKHLPLRRIFATFEFGEPEVAIAISKSGGIFLYSTKYKWPQGSDKRGRGTSGQGSILPTELRRFWDEPVEDN